MNIGQMNKRITIQTVTTTQDSYGSQSESWADTVTVWGAIWPLSGKEIVNAGQVEADFNVRIRIRYRSSVTVKNRIKYGSRYFNIKEVINLNEKNQWLELMCEERLSDA